MSFPRLPPCDHEPEPYDGPSKSEVLRDRRDHSHPALFTLYQEPLTIVEGHRQYAFDETGRRYLDLLAGIATVGCGHSHPKIADQIKRQVAREMGVLMGKGGYFGNVLRIKPPLCITKQDADVTVEVLHQALESVSRRK